LRATLAINAIPASETTVKATALIANRLIVSGLLAAIAIRRWPTDPEGEHDRIVSNGMAKLAFAGESW
jgi:hypothetical protein